jgi:type II secretory pathway pseudopilin PulG
VIIIRVVSSTDKAKDAEIKSNITALADAIRAYAVNKGHYPISTSQSDCKIFPGSVEKIQDTSCSGKEIIDQKTLSMIPRDDKRQPPDNFFYYQTDKDGSTFILQGELYSTPAFFDGTPQGNSEIFANDISKESYYDTALDFVPDHVLNSKDLFLFNKCYGVSRLDVIDHCKPCDLNNDDHVNEVDMDAIRSIEDSKPDIPSP